MNAFDVLKERGFIEQMTHEDELRELFAKEKVTFYIGYDPTADSLTAGHFLTAMALAHLQRAGHRPITLMGGGTGMVGDPTDKTEMRKMMTPETIEHNVNRFKKQFSRFIDYENGKAIMENNADWLMKLNYVTFIRDYGVHFSVNRMLATDVYKSRFEHGLTFFELNYMIMQAYDFLELNRRYGCTVQIGGSEQWSNILAGMELIRRVENKNAYGMTLTLLTTGDGVKMGKTMAGALWLDAEKTSPYEFYQYFRNTDDRGVEKNLKLLTFLSLEEISEAMKGNINDAKKLLAYNVAKIVHGEEEAVKAQNAASALFGGGGSDDSSMPQTVLALSEISEGINIIELLEKAGLIPSRGEGRRLVVQGGVAINGEKVTDINHVVRAEDFTDNELLIKKGKKSFHKIKLSD